MQTQFRIAALNQGVSVCLPANKPELDNIRYINQLKQPLVHQPLTPTPPAKAATLRAPHEPAVTALQAPSPVPATIGISVATQPQGPPITAPIGVPIAIPSAVPAPPAELKIAEKKETAAVQAAADNAVPPTTKAAQDRHDGSTVSHGATNRATMSKASEKTN